MTNSSVIKGFGSDNHAPIHPNIIQSIIEANVGHAHSYGMDEWTQRLQQKIKLLFGPDTIGFLVFNGTAANILSLKTYTKTFHSVLCTDVSHINVDECGGPEIYGQFKLIPTTNLNGKIQIDQLSKCLVRKGDQHFSQPKGVSLTQPTELGTCYSIDELKKIIALAKQNNLFVHIDGARLANAAIHLKTSLKELTFDLNIDVLSLGGTKNGLMGAELVIFKNEAIADDFKFIRKQMAQLPSKTRFLAAQFLGYFENDLWLKLAQHCHTLAVYFKNKLTSETPYKCEYAVESNALFVKIPQSLVKHIRKHFFFYVWDESTFVCRLMISWDSTKDDVDSFINIMKNFKENSL